MSILERIQRTHTPVYQHRASWTVVRVAVNNSIKIRLQLLRRHIKASIRLLLDKSQSHSATIKIPRLLKISRISTIYIDIVMFESPSKRKDQQIDVATLAVSRVGLNGSLFNRLRCECKLTHLHVRPLIGSRQKSRHFVRMDNFQRKELCLCVLTWRDDAISLLDSGGGQPYPLGSGGAFLNAALACDADRTCQQMKPNERHLRYSLEQLLAAQDQERTGGPLTAMRQRHLRCSPALRLILQVMGTSDKTLSRSDVLIEGPKNWRSLCFLLSVID